RRAAAADGGRDHPGRRLVRRNPGALPAWPWPLRGRGGRPDGAAGRQRPRLPAARPRRAGKEVRRSAGAARQGHRRGLRPGRARADVPADDKSGYVGQAQVIAMAEAAGFKLQESSEVNANPRDTKDHPNGVWTLPPSNNHDAADADKYKAIGESDRMTLRFVK